MQTLTFRGDDMSGLLDLLIEAVEITAKDERPAIIVSGKRYEPFDLMKVACLVPDGELTAQQEAKISKIFKKTQHGCRRTAANLAARMEQIHGNRRTYAGVRALMDCQMILREHETARNS